MIKLDKYLSRWLIELSESWQLTREEVALILGEEEIYNRLHNYPKVAHALQVLPLDLHRFAVAARECWVLGGRFDSVRFNAFVSSGNEASETLQRLIQDFPSSDEAASERIDDFIEDAVILAYSTPKDTSDLAGAAQLASLVLTAVFPDRFPDYRRSRWEAFASTFDYEKPAPKTTHGEWIVWAGKFASAIVQTETFRKFWPNFAPRLSVPIWVISGICWEGLKPSKPRLDPVDPQARFFPEGAVKRRLHLVRERNRSVVAQAKELRVQKDPLLRCEVCGFSFVKKYGPLGQGFIEAHHLLPIADLKRGGKTSAKDLALLCSNCHRMIHSGEKTLTPTELQEQMNLSTSLSRGGPS